MVKLKIAQWYNLGLELGVTEDSLKEANSIQDVFLLAIDMSTGISCQRIVEGLLSIGDYKTAEKLLFYQGL